MNTVAIVQARLGSTRLPGKVLKKIVDRPMIELLLLRLSKSKEIDSIVVATTFENQDDELQNFVESLGYKCTRGSTKDVLNRYYDSAKAMNAETIVRITGDCPLVDSSLVDKFIQIFNDSSVDYLSNSDPCSFPDGLDIEVMSFNSLKEANKKATLAFDREHVTPYIRKSKAFIRKNISHTNDLSKFRFTVDEPEDLEVVTNIFKYFSSNIYFTWMQVLKLKENQPNLFEANMNIMNNEGSVIGTGQKLYKRAKTVIPGGTMLLSKRPEMFLPEKWPSYFSKAKGCKVWDLDGEEYIDMSIMGIGTNILGYGHPEVNEAVLKAVTDGNMSTLNCPEEVYLIEKLIAMHPWAEMGRLARSGGEINSIAIRIARAATGRDKVAICGYHGWHDWYLSSNLNSDKNLDGHLLPGLKPNGVPRGLIGTTLPFNYNDIEHLKKMIDENPNQIAAIKMEVSRNDDPKNDFLKKVRKLATENSIVLIFDECTSGFRETFGGLHKKFGVNPDMAVFAKALGNGYAISACIGIKDIMQSAESTFISSTFWTERTGPTAAVKSLEIMEREKSWQSITNTGLDISDKWNKLANKYNLNINNFGIPALCGFTFNSDNSQAYKTLITQEMLKDGFLASNCVYSCINHSEKIVDDYFALLDPIFKKIQECENGRDIKSILDGPISHSTFKRLN
jgi:glutamate-1-semialdehyde 2,1-aminomutase